MSFCALSSCWPRLLFKLVEEGADRLSLNIISASSYCKSLFLLTVVRNGVLEQLLLSCAKSGFFASNNLQANVTI